MKRSFAGLRGWASGFSVTLLSKRAVRVILLGAVILLVLFVIWFYVDPAGAKERIDTGQLLATVAGGILLLVGVYFTAKRDAVVEQGQITDRFTKAIEQLGSENLVIRLGGIYALERIARDSSRDHWTIMEILSSFVRENAPWPTKEMRGHSSATQILPHLRADPYIGLESPATDIQAILTVLGRRTLAHEKDADRALQLNGVDLRQAKLEGAYLRGASFFASCLAFADLRGANLQRANFEQANVQDTDFRNAKIQGAKFGFLILPSHPPEALQVKYLWDAIGLMPDKVEGAHSDKDTVFPSYFLPNVEVSSRSD